VQKISVGDEHQQIYGWRGAINSFNYFEGETYYLSNSFRFGNEIANLASLILYVKGEKIVLTGNEKVCSIISEKKPRSYTQLCRTNANLITKIIENIRKKVYVVGGTKEILALARSGFALYLGDLSNNKHSKIRTFKSWSKLIEFKEKFDDPDVSFLVNIIEDYGSKFGNVISKIEKAKFVKEEDASVILSTIHKAKGREWNNVSIGGDFTLFMKDESMKTLLSENIEEFNLLYVAITRAKEKLYLETDVERFMGRLQSYCNPIVNNI
jgi:superfamily I DNA/RNA helicase